MLLSYFFLFFSINLKSNIKLVSVPAFRWRWGRCAPYLNKKKGSEQLYGTEQLWFLLDAKTKNLMWERKTPCDSSLRPADKNERTDADLLASGCCHIVADRPLSASSNDFYQ